MRVGGTVRKEGEGGDAGNEDTVRAGAGGGGGGRGSRGSTVGVWAGIGPTLNICFVFNK